MKIKEIYQKYKEIINYLIIGGLTTAVSLIIYYALTFTILDANKPLELQIANIISWIFAVAFAYITNKKYVFESKEKINIKEISKFTGGRVLTLLLDMLCMFIFVTIFKLNDKIIKIFVQILVIILNYIISKFFVFKKD